MDSSHRLQRAVELDFGILLTLKKSIGNQVRFSLHRNIRLVLLAVFFFYGVCASINSCNVQPPNTPFTTSPKIPAPSQERIIF